jgi:hypothetical protein
MRERRRFHCRDRHGTAVASPRAVVGKEGEMLKKAAGLLGIAGLAVVVAACAVTGPDPVPAAPAAGVEGLASASGGNLPPAGKPVYCGSLVLTRIDSAKGTATVQAYWADQAAKTFRSTCPVPVFSIDPATTMFVPRYNPYRVTFAGKPGSYVVTASIDDLAYKPVSLPVDLE